MLEIILLVLVLVALELAVIVWLLYRQHRAMVEWLDAYAEMVGDSLFIIEDYIRERRGQ